MNEVENKQYCELRRERAFPNMKLIGTRRH